MSGFSPRARAAIFVIALVSLVATVVTVLYGQRLDEPDSDDISAFGRGAVGHRALVEFYEAAGVHSLVDREGVHQHATAPMLFIEPMPRVEFDERLLSLDAVLKARRKAGLDSIVVLPKWSLRPDGSVARLDKHEVERVLDAATGPWARLELRREDLPIAATAMLREWTVDGDAGPRRVVLQERQALRVDDPFEFEILLGSPSAALIVRVRERLREGQLIIVSDPDLLHNYNLQRGDHGQIALDLLAELDTDSVVIDEVFHQNGFHRTLGAALGRFPAVLIVIQALIVALLFVLAGARSFGRQRIPAPGRRSTEALIDLAVRVLLDDRRSQRITASYLSRVLAATAERLGVPETHTVEARARAIDRAAAERGLEGGAVALVHALVQTKPRNKTAHLAIARRAYALRRRLSSRRSRHPESKP